MKNKYFRFPVALLIFSFTIVIFGNCRRLIQEAREECVTCSYEYDSSYYDSDEYCGQPDEVADFRNSYMDLENYGYIVTCN